MPLTFVVPSLALLGFAAWRDVATRTIPDGIGIALAVLGLALRCAQGWQALGSSVAVAAGLFLVLLFCHARGATGGGDVKLLTALALGLPPLGSYQLVVATALIGGVLAVLYLILGRVLVRVRPSPPPRFAPTLRRIATIEARRIRRRGPLPYGVAIALGATLVLLHSPGG